MRIWRVVYVAAAVRLRTGYFGLICIVSAGILGFCANVSIAQTNYDEEIYKLMLKWGTSSGGDAVNSRLMVDQYYNVHGYYGESPIGSGYTDLGTHDQMVLEQLRKGIGVTNRPYVTAGITGVVSVSGSSVGATNLDIFGTMAGGKPCFSVFDGTVNATLGDVEAGDSHFHTWVDNPATSITATVLGPITIAGTVSVADSSASSWLGGIWDQLDEMHLLLNTWHVEWLAATNVSGSDTNIDYEWEPPEVTEYHTTSFPTQLWTVAQTGMIGAYYTNIATYTNWMSHTNTEPVVQTFPLPYSLGRQYYVSNTFDLKFSGHTYPWTVHASWESGVVRSAVDCVRKLGLILLYAYAWTSCLAVWRLFY